MDNNIFLTARWEHLIMVNYPVDPEVLRPHVPAGTELDDWQGRAYMSVVGFLFLDTRVMGWAIPFHRNFEEVNLRFYVRYRHEGRWERGVVFISEIVPRRAIAAVANTLYNEHYRRLPMRHERQVEGGRVRVQYEWKWRGEWQGLRALAEDHPQPISEGSEEEFIAEHYWGFSRSKSGRTTGYRVEHPRWRIYPVRDFELQADIANLYGPEFVPFVESGPSSVFLAEGSKVQVRRGFRVDG